MLIRTKKEISQADFNYYLKASEKEFEEFCKWAGHFSEYPTAGYSMRDPRLEKSENKYYLTWLRSDSCD